MPLVYIVEDDEDIRELSVYALRSGGFDCEGYESAADFLEALEHERPDLALLDIMLPGEDGLSLLKRLRGSKRFAQLPVIMLTARGDEVDKVVGLELGADDYLTKPFSHRELLARIRAVLRRSQAGGETAEVLAVGDVRMNVDRHEVTLDGEPIQLALKEFQLLEILLRNAGRVLTRTQLISRVWGDDYVGDTKTLDVHIKRLRSKLEPDPSNPQHLLTVRGLGYRYEN